MRYERLIQELETLAGKYEKDMAIYSARLLREASEAIKVLLQEQSAEVDDGK